MEENKRQKRIQKRAAQREALALSLEEEDRARARQQAEAAAAAAATTAGSGAGGPATGAVPPPPPPELTKNVSYLLGPGASKRVEVCWWLCGHGCMAAAVCGSAVTIPCSHWRRRVLQAVALRVEDEEPHAPQDGSKLEEVEAVLELTMPPLPPSIVDQVFGGRVLNVVVCDQCHESSTRVCVWGPNMLPGVFVAVTPTRVYLCRAAGSAHGCFVAVSWATTEERRRRRWPS